MAAFGEIAEENVVQSMVFRGFSHRNVAQHYCSLFPNYRGISARSVRRYCRERNIRRIDDNEVTDAVRRRVLLYGDYYGRRLMQGSLHSELGVTSGAVSQRRIARALLAVAPQAYRARATDTLARTNPVPYFAPYFGYKGHFDQNEKIGQTYGCTHVAFIDGCSRLVAGYASMPIKNPILIYTFVFRPAVVKYGIWEQIRMDHGQEFCLVIFVQRILSPYRNQQTRNCFRQTQSTKNYVAERFWPEVNRRINNPLKRAMNSIVETEDLDVDDAVLKYCMSWVMLYVSQDAVDNLLQSWNHHRVSGPTGCVPIENMMATRQNAYVPHWLIPSTSEAIRMYEANGGRLTRNSNFGIDPLMSHPHLYESRDRLFYANALAPSQVFSDVVHGSFESLKNTLFLYYETTTGL